MKYKRYDKYKETGVEWLKEIPVSWSILKFRFLYKSSMGSTILASDLVNSGIIPVYSATESDKIFGYVNKSQVILNKDDLVIPARGNSIGNLMIVKEDVATSTQTTIYAKKLYNNINDVRFVFYYCKSLSNILFEYEVTAIPQITVSQVKNNLIAIPPLFEQKEITKYLDEKTSKIDLLLQKLGRQKELLVEKRSALINKAVTRGLNPDVKMKKTGIDWLSEVPKNWNIKKLKYSCKNLVDKNNRLGLLPVIDLEHVVSCEGRLSMNRKYLPFVENSNGRLFFEKGCVLYGKLRPYLKKVIFANFGGYCSSEFFVLQTDQVSGFLFYLCLSDIFNSLANSSAYGVKMPRTSWDIMGYLLFAFPEPFEQKQIANYLDKQTAKIDLLQSKTDRQIELLKEYRASLITSAVTGQIKITSSSN